MKRKSPTPNNPKAIPITIISQRTGAPMKLNLIESHDCDPRHGIKFRVLPDVPIEKKRRGK